MPCRINVFSGENAKGRHAKTRQFGRVFAWRPFASPGKDTTNSSRKHNAWNVAYFHVAGRKVAMRKHKKVTIWRVFAWRPLAFSPLLVVSLPGGAKGRHAKTRQIVILVGFRVATFRPARQRYDKQEAKRRRMNSVVLSYDGAKGRHAKTRKSHHLAGFRVAPFRQENTIIRHDTNQPP